MFLMGSDSIGSLSQSGGVISLSPSLLTIGGQQYRVSSTISRTITTDVTMVANTLYIVFAVLNSGNIELRVSANMNSVGPSGFSIWKIVGAFYANGAASPAFGSFVNISGPASTGPISWVADTTKFGGFGTPTGFGGTWWRQGSRVFAEGACTIGTVSAAPGTVPLPTNLLIDSNSVGGTIMQGNMGNSGPFGSPIGLTYVSGTTDRFRVGIASSSLSVGIQNSTNVSSYFGNSTAVTFNFNCHVSGWSQVQLTDL